MTKDEIFNEIVDWDREIDEAFKRVEKEYKWISECMERRKEWINKYFNQDK